MTSDPLSNSPWSDNGSSDLAATRAQAEEELHAIERLRATRVVAASARDKAEALDLLAMLGLGTTEMLAARGQRTFAA